ncbi:MAG: class I SAM-dependent methyltransferase [Chloroflexi bacterium]|nr:class I SAM-dependent methyltransferase [Chloroflexota bacterium]
MEDYLWPHLEALPYFRGMLRAVEARLMHAVPLPPLSLDIGCGDGHFASTAFENKIDVGFDPDRKSLMEAKSRGAHRSLVQASGDELPFTDSCFASALSNSVLEHVSNLEGVLAEIGRVLEVDAPLAITVPNPGYRSELSLPRFLRRLRLRRLSLGYRDWFMRMSRTWNLLDERGWGALFKRTGFEVKQSQRYFSPSALRALEWGHYFGAPTLIARYLTGRWILVPSRWNLLLTERFTRRYYREAPSPEGTYTFYLAAKVGPAEAHLSQARPEVRIGNPRPEGN